MHILTPVIIVTIIVVIIFLMYSIRSGGSIPTTINEGAPEDPEALKKRLQGYVGRRYQTPSYLIDDGTDDMDTPVLSLEETDLEIEGNRIGKRKVICWLVSHKQMISKAIDKEMYCDSITITGFIPAVNCIDSQLTVRTSNGLNGVIDTGSTVFLENIQSIKE